MGLIVLLIVLILLFGGGGFYYGPLLRRARPAAADCRCGPFVQGQSLIGITVNGTEESAAMSAQKFFFKATWARVLWR